MADTTVVVDSGPPIYSGFDIGPANASVTVLAERLGAEGIATLDHRHFRAIRPRHVESFTLLPEL